MLKIDGWIVTMILFFSPMVGMHSQPLTAVVTDDDAHIVEDGDSILVYQAKSKSISGKYSRSNYIHPLYGLDGKVLTEDFPSDHPHHRGIFWAWHQLYVGDQHIGDGWAIDDFNWDVVSIKLLRNQEPSKAFEVEVLWKSPNWLSGMKEKALVREITTIRAYPREDEYRNIDIDIELLALVPDVRIGGSNDEKGYGGFSTRINLPEDVTFSGSQGLVRPNNLPVEAGAWMDISGSMGKNGAEAGISIISHPSNPGFPNPWILRAKNSMQNAVYPHPGSMPVELSDKNPTRLRYRLTVHQGRMDRAVIDEIFLDYTKL